MWLFFHKDATSLKHRRRREEVVYSSLLSLVVHPRQRRLLCLYMQKTLWLAMNINTSGFVQGETLLCDRSEWNRKTAAMSQPEHTVSKEAGILHAPKGRFTVYMRHKGFLFPRLFTKTIYHQGK